MRLLAQSLNFLYGYLKHFPRCNGEGETIANAQLNTILNFVDNMNIKHHDVYMRLFVQSLKWDLRKWFKEF